MDKTAAEFLLWILKTESSSLSHIPPPKSQHTTIKIWGFQLTNERQNSVKKTQLTVTMPSLGEGSDGRQQAAAVVDSSRWRQSQMTPDSSLLNFTPSSSVFHLSNSRPSLSFSVCPSILSSRFPLSPLMLSLVPSSHPQRHQLLPSFLFCCFLKPLPPLILLALGGFLFSQNPLRSSFPRWSSLCGWCLFFFLYHLPIP